MYAIRNMIDLLKVGPFPNSGVARQFSLARRLSALVWWLVDYLMALAVLKWR